MGSEHPNGGFTCWSQGQLSAREQLLQISETFFEQRWRSPIATTLRPRFDPLVVGASGTGKSHLIRTISRTLGVPLLRVTYGEWIVLAARENPHTLERVHAFVEENPRGIIHVDELDKFRSLSTSDWSVAVMVELFLLLDRTLQQPMRDLKWTSSLQDRLSNSMLMIGTGTWQSAWSDLDKPPIGFQTEQASNCRAIQQEIIKRCVIPTELLRRFRSQLIVLPPPDESDYRQASELFGLNELAGRLGVQLDFSSAKELSLGARWLEEQLADLLRLAHVKGILAVPEHTDIFDDVQESEDDLDATDCPV